MSALKVWTEACFFFFFLFWKYEGRGHDLLFPCLDLSRLKVWFDEKQV